MSKQMKNKGLISGCIVFYLIVLGLMGILVFEVLMNTENVHAATIIVDKNGHGDYQTIQEAIDNASAGDTIRVWDGIYNETLEIYFNIKLIGNGSGNTTIDASESWWESPVYICASYVNISGFNIMNSPSGGIFIDSSSYVNIFNNTISNNYNGLELIFSTNILVKDNIFSNNSNSITITECSSCNIKNNSIENCAENGVILDCSKQITISKNIFNDCGLSIRSNPWGDYVSHWTTHNIDNTNKVNGKSLIYWHDRTSGKVPIAAGQIILANCSNIMIDSQNCSYTSDGILIGLSSQITVKNSIFCFNFNGINIQQSDNITIINNNFSFNRNNGISISESPWNNISNNTVSSNEYCGINLDWMCNKNIIKNNICNNNHDCGFYLSFCNNNTISHNEFNNNWNFGLFLGWQCRDLEVTNNEMCNNNITGLYLGAASGNKISINNISNNDFGIQVGWDCRANQIYENLISYNRDTGVELGSSCVSTKVYHNNFISNKKNALDTSSSTNSWYKNNEGNYWSDYTGKDDGSAGRFCGDLIGDTDIPHPTQGYDDYPFIIPTGWRYPGAPLLYNPPEIDSDGDYNLTWGFNYRALGYILEEDDNEAFNSPTMVYNGTGVSCELKNRVEGKYFYRLQLYNNYYHSDWSSIVNITVDFVPEIPANFIVTVFPSGNALNVSWEPNSADTTCYELYYKTNGMVEFDLLVNITHPGHSYSHINLIDGQTYYYKMRTKDGYWQASPFSSVLSAIPADSVPPNAPTLLSAEAVSDSKIKLTWEANDNVDDADLAGYLIYMHDPMAQMPDQVGVFELRYTLPKSNTTCILSGLKEQVNYQFKIKAYDEVPNNSSFSNVMNATTPDETHPNPPTELKVTNLTHYSLALSWQPSIDTDIIGYIVYRSRSLSTDFMNITEIISDTTYMDTGLDEVTIYYYKLQAVDDAELASMFSEPVYGITLLGPKPPVVEQNVQDFDLEEDSMDNTTISLFNWFKDANDDPLTFRCEGQKHIEVTIDPATGQVSLKPEVNWNGIEHLTIFANDGIFEINDTVTVTVIPVNDAPKNIKIIKPQNGLEIQDHHELAFEGQCSDPDLPYGDVLTFTWHSSITGPIGTGSNLTGIILEPGVHTVTLEVTDKHGEKLTTSINLTVQQKIESKDSESDDSDFYIYVTSGVLVVILILCILYMAYKSKRTRTHESEKQSIIDETEE